MRTRIAACAAVALCVSAASGQCQWETLGAGIEAPVSFYAGVRAIEFYGGDLYVGGGFTEAGGVPAARIARWDGEAWSSVGGGVTAGIAGNSSINALAVYDGKLYAAGQWFTHVGGVASSNIAAWNGAGWESLDGGVGIGDGFSRVEALEVYGGSLYIGGTFTSAGGIAANRIVRWDGSEFHALGSGLSGGGGLTRVNCMRVYDGSLYVAGEFSTAGGVPVVNVAKWDGQSWSAVGEMQPICYALEVFQGSLYAGGGSVIQGEYLARWDGESWVSALVMGDDGLNGQVWDMAAHDGLLYIGGSFTMADGLLVNNITAWDGRQWSAFASPETGCDDMVFAVAPQSDSLIVGGEFTFAGGSQSNMIAKWACAACESDYTGDGVIGVDDLLYVINNWGEFDVDDLLAVVNDWGVCG